MSNKELAPGSLAARLKGCKCPIYDNHHGRGWHGISGVFVTVDKCKLHGEKAKRKAVAK